MLKQILALKLAIRLMVIDELGDSYKRNIAGKHYKSITYI